MNNQPGAVDLLEIARETLLGELRPLLPEHARYTLAMVANAMAIAAREIEAGESAARAALARLDGLYGTPARDLSPPALREALADRERELARDIRGGRFDRKNKRRVLLEHLRLSVEARLAVSNPKILTQRDPVSRDGKSSTVAGSTSTRTDAG